MKPKEARLAAQPLLSFPESFKNSGENDAMQSLRKSWFLWLAIPLTLTPSRLWALPHSSAQPESTTHAALVLGQGEQRILRIPGLKRYSVGGPEIRILPSPDGSSETLLVKAVRPGLSDLLIWKSDGSTENRPVEVHRWKSSDARVGAIEKALSHLSQAEVYLGTENGKSVYTLRGEIQSIEELKRIDILSKSPQIQNETMPSLPLYESNLKKIETWLDSRTGKRALFLESELTTRSIIVRGSVKDPEEKKKITAALKILCPFAALEIDSMPDSSPTVHFQVFLLELKRNQLGSLGLDLASQIGRLSVHQFAIQTASTLEAKIIAMEGEGNARLLSQPQLSVRAPGEAELFAGGELPIETHSTYHSQVSWRSYGLQLKLKVSAATSRRIRTDIFTEVSHLDPSLAIDKIPGIQANRMKTQVDADFGVPLLLSGLLQEGTRKAVRGLPILKDLPVIGLLFSSIDWQEERSELVAILLPSLSPPSAPMKSLNRNFPTGPVPVPRTWMSPNEEIALKASPEYPWNVFEPAPI